MRHGMQWLFLASLLWNGVVYAGAHISIYYQRADDSYANWGLYTWKGSVYGAMKWTDPSIAPVEIKQHAAVFNIELAEGSDQLAFLVRSAAGDKEAGDKLIKGAKEGDRFCIFNDSNRVVKASAAMQSCDQRIQWLDQTHLVWPYRYAADQYLLVSSDSASLSLNNGQLMNVDHSVELLVDPNGVPQALKDKFKLAYDHDAMLANLTPSQAQALLQGQLFGVAIKDGRVIDVTGVQLPGVLDDLYAYKGDLGLNFKESTPHFALWAPTAQAVSLHLFSDETSAAYQTRAMTMQDGVWHLQGDPSWRGQYYLYEVTVYNYHSDKIEQYLVTDPYSISLSQNSRRSQIVNLYDTSDASIVPSGFDKLVKPALQKPEDMVVYELHVRDFSIHDTSVPEPYRGTYKAFTQENSNGMLHLKSLAQAGLTHLHLLPVFDIASVNEDPAMRQEPVGLSAQGSAKYDATNKNIMAQYAGLDGFNWGYDPLHYGAPEGSYATNPNGVTRVYEFRDMVAHLAKLGLKVVMDVVYNHTSASGLSDQAVLDKVVPGYYHRRSLRGFIENSTCCENTATEHVMMEKLMIDTLLLWAKAYKVDGFRFDLMGHHMKQNILHVRQALDALTLEKDGVDGRAIYLYGEGWNFGEVANNQRGENATQFNMAGTGIGTYNDRIRDSVRGDCCGSLSQLRSQGFINGLAYDDNGFTTQGRTSLGDKEWLLKGMADDIRVSLAGNLKNYHYTNRNNNRVSGFGTKWSRDGVTAVGYTEDPQENILYVSKHDNQSLWDISQYKHPLSLSMYDRVRAHNVGMSIFMLGQGIPFLQAGAEMLRSKSLTRDSYNAGDWFNKLDWTYASNNWAVGQPVEGSPEEGVMDYASSILSTVAAPTSVDIKAGVNHFRELLRIRQSSPLFHLATQDQVNTRLSFHNVGDKQNAGVIVMSITDGSCAGVDLDTNYDEVMVIINARHNAIEFNASGWEGWQLHPVHLDNVDADSEVQKSSFAADKFSVPKRTSAIFVQPQGKTRRAGHCNASPSVIDPMYLRGDFNAWGHQGMRWVDGQWRYLANFAQAGALKFDAFGNFAQSYGDNEGDFKADLSGKDIAYSAGLLLISFDYNATNKPYTIQVLDKNHDYDGDAMPDQFESQYGLDPFSDDAQADLDGDGYSNLAEMQAQSDPRDKQSIPHTQQNCELSGYVYHDFNCDGKSDLVWRHKGTGETYWYAMQGLSAPVMGFIGKVGLSWDLAAIGDFNGDKEADILWRNHDTGENWLYLMRSGKRVQDYRLNKVTDLAWQVVTAADFDADGDSDVLWYYPPTGSLYVYLMQAGKVSQGIALSARSSNLWKLSGTGDLNADGVTDLIWRHRNTGAVYADISMNGHFEWTKIATVADQGWQLDAVGDFDGDHKDDLLWRHHVSGQNYIYLMDGAVRKQSSALNAVPLDWKIGALADYDGDGQADILWRNQQNGTNFVYLMQGVNRLSQGRLNAVSLDWTVY